MFKIFKGTNHFWNRTSFFLSHYNNYLFLVKKKQKKHDLYSSIQIVSPSQLPRPKVKLQAKYLKTFFTGE